MFLKFFKFLFSGKKQKEKTIDSSIQPHLNIELIDLTRPNFKASEFWKSTVAERNNIDNTPDQQYILSNLMQTADQMQILHSYLQSVYASNNVVIDITSGYRCEKLNVLVKGSPTSRHKSGLAVDIKVRVNKKILPLKVVMNHIIDAEINFDQILIENALNIIHIGFAINPLKARKQVKYAWIDKNNNWKTKKL